MQITCYLSPACSSRGLLESNIARALEAEGISAAVTFKPLDADEAARLGLAGSPSVFIDGEEFQPLDETGFS